MALMAFNLTGAPVALAAGGVTLPASASPPSRSAGYNVTSELHPNAAVDPARGIAGGLDAADFTALQAQVAGGSVVYEWTGDEEYLTGALSAGGPVPGIHAPSHQNGGSDEVSVAGLSGELADAQPMKDLGVIASFRLVQSGQPVAADTLVIGADTYEVDGVGANINFASGAAPEDTLDNLLAAIQASGTENVKATKISATVLDVQAADAPDGVPVASDPSIAVVNGLTNYVSSIGDANMNTLAGRAEGLSRMVAVSLAITAAMVTATEARVSLPFTPTGFLPVVLTSTGAIKAAGADTFTIDGDDIVVALGGADIVATDVVRLIVW